MLSLDNLEGVKDLHRTDFYSLITGVAQEDIPFGVATTRVDPFSDKINLDNMGLYMKAVELLEKRHGGFPGIYQHSIDETREAYKRRDLEGFKEGIRYILFDIVND